MSVRHRLARLERAVGLTGPCPVCHGRGCTLADTCIVTAVGDEDPPPPPPCPHCGRTPKEFQMIILQGERPPGPTLQELLIAAQKGNGSNDQAHGQRSDEEVEGGTRE